MVTQCNTHTHANIHTKKVKNSSGKNVPSLHLWKHFVHVFLEDNWNIHFSLEIRFGNYFYFIFIFWQLSSKILYCSYSIVFQRGSLKIRIWFYPSIRNYLLWNLESYFILINGKVTVTNKLRLWLSNQQPNYLLWNLESQSILCNGKAIVADILRVWLSNQQTNYLLWNLESYSVLRSRKAMLVYKLRVCLLNQQTNCLLWNLESPFSLSKKKLWWPIG